LQLTQRVVLSCHFVKLLEHIMKITANENDTNDIANVSMTPVIMISALQIELQ